MTRAGARDADPRPIFRVGSVLQVGALRAVDRPPPMNDEALLVLDRFCGRETHPITEGRWNLYHDDELDLPTLCIRLRAGPGRGLHEDTQTLHAQPHWELNVVQAGLVPATLQAGATFTIPDGCDDDQGGYVTNFYYCSHESSEANRIEILARHGDTLRVRLRGETVDVNYYDGSRPPTVLSAELDLTHDPQTRRSMC
jgi:hypothetical protein